jgi:hypothetical protein
VNASQASLIGNAPTATNPSYTTSFPAAGAGAAIDATKAYAAVGVGALGAVNTLNQVRVVIVYCLFAF